MELTHEFTVPASVEETWRALNDIEGVAGCFPGATVSSVEGDTFKGSCKVKLGPIALVYNGSGSFVDKDEAAHTMRIEAKGKDRRGNGTAGADVTATMTEADGGTKVRVVTDLAITGKPAQFGRGVIQDVSDKLLGQFVDCLAGRLGQPSEDTGETAAAETTAGAAPAAGIATTPDAGAREGEEVAAGLQEAGAGPADTFPEAAGTGATTGEAGISATSRPAQDALDLGAAVLPVLLKTYGKQLAGALAVAFLVVWLIRRRR